MNFTISIDKGSVVALYAVIRNRDFPIAIHIPNLSLAMGKEIIVVVCLLYQKFTTFSRHIKDIWKICIHFVLKLRLLVVMA